MTQSYVSSPLARVGLTLILAGSVVAAAAISGCSSSGYAPGSDGAFAPATGGRGNSADDGAADDGLATDGGQGGARPLPPEVEDETSFRAPVVTGSYLWSSNPESGRVALIGARDSSVRLLSAGLRPTEVFALPTPDEEPRALVQNRGSQDASLLELHGGTIAERRIKTPAAVNRWTISRDGAWGIAFAVSETPLDPTEGLQEIAVVDLWDPEREPARLTVGYRPRAVTVAGDRAVVVCEDGLALLELGELVQVERWIDLGSGVGLDTSVTPDGNYALVRRADSATIEIIDLEATDETLEITMASPVTDLDLTSEGRVVAVARDAGEVLTFLMEEIDAGSGAVQRTTIEGATVGSAVVSEGGARALLYSTAVSERKVTVVELEAELAHRTIELQHEVQGIAASHDGNFGVVFGPGAQVGRGVFSLLRLDEERFPRVVGTRAPIQFIAVAGTGALIATAAENVYEAYAARLPELSVESFGLASRPLSVGIVDAELGFVAQSHPEGRITFLGIRTGEVRTVSGYELSAEVIEE